ncbi:MAG: low molecular weight protein-tyrosine-phosphatase [Burkholderiales bacterium]
MLFVCTNNICRSPMAEGVLRTLARDAGMLPGLAISSAATHPNCVGQPVDARARVAAERRGFVIPKRHARMISARDFARHSWILAMDRYNLESLEPLRPPGYAGHLGLLGALDPAAPPREIDDPYFGALAGFDRAIDRIERYCALLLEVLSGRD